MHGFYHHASSPSCAAAARRPARIAAGIAATTGTSWPPWQPRGGSAWARPCGFDAAASLQVSRCRTNPAHGAARPSPVEPAQISPRASVRARVRPRAGGPGAGRAARLHEPPGEFPAVPELRGSAYSRQKSVVDGPGRTSADGLLEAVGTSGFFPGLDLTPSRRGTSDTPPPAGWGGGRGDYFGQLGLQTPDQKLNAASRPQPKRGCHAI